MKKIIALLLALVMVLGMAACGGSTTEETKAPEAPAVDGGETATPDLNTALAGDYGDITLWVSDTVLEDGTSVAGVTETMVAEFQKLYPDIKFTFKVDGLSEGDAASQVLTDVASAPDIYCFAQDQLARLVQAQALVALADSVADTIKAENSAQAASAASVAGTMYAYPLTADNGFYMYYDKTVFTEEDVEDLATMVAVAEANGGKIRFALENAWYNAGFFFATGCTSGWTMNAEGKWTGVEDTYNSENGLAAMKGMQILAKSPAYDSNADIFTDAVAIVTGTWNSKAAAKHFGENLAATDLPSFTVDGNTYHINSYFGCKLMGIKPQSGDNAANKTIVLQLLAQYLTNKDNQLTRFSSFGWGPSNLEAQADPIVVADPSLAAFAKQAEYSVMQGNINGSWWDIAKLLGNNAKDATTDEELMGHLKTYEDAILALLTKSDEELNAWGVIGGICGTAWDTDFPMTETETKGTYLSEVLELKAGEEFKCRQGGSWDVNFGVEFNGANVVVEADGKYQVQLVWDGATNGTITLIPVA